MSNFTLQDYKDMDTYLLYELGLTGALTENYIRKLTAKQNILNESFEENGNVPEIFLTEAKAYDNTGKAYDLPRLSVKYEPAQNVLAIQHGLEKPGETLRVPIGKVAQLWEDTANIESHRDLLQQLGVPAFELWIRSSNAIGNLGKKILEIYNNKYVPNNNDGATVLPTWNKRRRFYQAQRSYNTSADGSQTTRKDPSENIGKNSIDTGSGRRTNSSTIQNINQDNIFNGEFYRDRSRIKRGILYKFIQMMKRQSDDMNKKTDFGTLRVWKKTFLLGYYVERKMFFEIWYNSYNSKFVVYDMNGVEKADPTDSLQESIRMLVRIVAQESPDDRDILSSNRGGRNLSTSVSNAMAKNIRPDLKDKMREEEDIRREKRRERKEREEEIERQKKEQETKNYFKQTAKAMSDNLQKERKNAYEQKRKEREEEQRDREEFEKEKRKQEKEVAARQERDEEEKKARQNPSPSVDQQSMDKFVTNKKSRKSTDELMNDFNKKTNPSTEKAFADQQKRRDKIAKKKNANMTNADTTSDDSKAAGKGTYDFFERINEAFDDIVPYGEDSDYTYSDMTRVEREEEEEREEEKRIIDFEGREFDQTAQEVQAYALRSPYTKQMLLGDISDSIEEYTKTRVDKRSILRRLLDKIKTFRGRSERVVNPMTSFDKGSYIRRLGNTIFNEGVRADFIIGFTLNNIVNIEIWYITEFDSTTEDYVSSFYVYDVEAMKYIRTNLPYYRNAMQVVGQKISVQQD